MSKVNLTDSRRHHSAGVLLATASCIPLLKLAVGKTGSMLVVAVLMSIVLRPSAAFAVPATPAPGAIESEEEQREVFNESLAAFDEGLELAARSPERAQAAFARARDGWLRLTNSGVENGLLYFNIGNAALELGDVGEAIAYYRKAKLLAGPKPEIEANLAYARRLVRTPVKATGEDAALHTLFFWHYGTSLRSRFGVALVTWTLFWLGLALRRKARWPGATPILLTLAILACVMAGSVGVELAQRADSTPAVLVADNVTLRKGNGDTYDPVFREPLHQGVELQVLENRRGWSRIRLPDRTEGWLPADRLLVI